MKTKREWLEIVGVALLLGSIRVLIDSGDVVRDYLIIIVLAIIMAILKVIIEFYDNSKK